MGTKSVRVSVDYTFFVLSKIELINARVSWHWHWQTLGHITIVSFFGSQYSRTMGLSTDIDP